MNLYVFLAILIYLAIFVTILHIKSKTITFNVILRMIIIMGLAILITTYFIIKHFDSRFDLFKVGIIILSILDIYFLFLSFRVKGKRLLRDLIIAYLVIWCIIPVFQIKFHADVIVGSRSVSDSPYGYECTKYYNSFKFQIYDTIF